MKKIIGSIVVLFIVSCGGTKTVTSDKKVLYEVLTQQSDGGANIRFFEILTEPNEIKMLQNDKMLKNKISSIDVQKSNFVILNMGEKETGGYSIKIESVEETAKSIIINIKEKSPEPSEAVLQEFTYPYSVIKINSKKEIIIK